MNDNIPVGFNDEGNSQWDDRIEDLDSENVETENEQKGDKVKIAEMRQWVVKRESDMGNGTLETLTSIIGDWTDAEVAERYAELMFKSMKNHETEAK